MSFKPTSVPTKRLSTSITSTQTTFKLDDIIGWNGVALTAADFGTQGYGVFRNSRSDLIEIFEFDPATIAATSITIVRRGLSFTGERTTEVSGNKLEWTAGDTFVDLGTDTPQLWQYLEDYINDVAVSGAPNASETVKGIVEEATAAQRAALTDIGETGAKLFVPPSKMDRSAVTLTPFASMNDGAAPVSIAVSGTTARVGQVIVPLKILANKITARVSGVSVAGTVDFTLYSEDGQTQIFSVTSATISATGIITVAIPSITILPGVYYILVNANTTANISFYFYNENDAPFENAQLGGRPASEPILRGTLVITASTPPTTFSPTAITSAGQSTLVHRLDN